MLLGIFLYMFFVLVAFCLGYIFMQLIIKHHDRNYFDNDKIIDEITENIDDVTTYCNNKMDDIKYNGPENTIYLNIKDFSDMKCPYQLMSIKQDGLLNADKYMHLRLKDNKIYMSYKDYNIYNNSFVIKRVIDNLSSNPNYEFIFNSSEYELSTKDKYYQKIVKENDLQDYNYYEVYNYLKKKNDFIRLNQSEIEDFKTNFDKIKKAYQNKIDSELDQIDFSNAKDDTQLKKDMNKLL